MRGEIGLLIRRDQSGFTLTEILIAVVILGVVVAVFSSVFGSSVSSIRGAGNHHSTLIEAQNLLDRALVDESLGEEDGVFREPWTLNEHEGTLYTVKLPWRTGFGAERELKLSTFKAR